MAQLPEKIDVERLNSENRRFAFYTAPTNIEVAEKLNEIIDYLGELEGGKDAGI